MMPHKGASTQCHNQHVLAKPRHQPSDRYQQAREKLQQKAKIKSRAYIQLGEKELQIVHRTFQPDTLVIIHLPALADGSLDSNLNSPPTLYVIQEGLNCMPTTDYFFTNVKPALIIVVPSSKSKQTNITGSSNLGSNFTTNTPLTARRNQSLPLYAYQQASTRTKSYGNQHYLTGRSTRCISIPLFVLPWWKRKYRRPKY